MCKTENKVAEKAKVKFHLRWSLYSIVKFYLRGIDSVSYVQPLMARIQQAKIGERIAIESYDPMIGNYTVVAVRKTLDSGIIITGWADNTSDVSRNIRDLLDTCYEVITSGVSSWDIKREKKLIEGEKQ